jgi:hypothetical protein
MSWNILKPTSLGRNGLVQLAWYVRATAAAACISRLAPGAPILYRYGSQQTEKMRREIQNPQDFHQHVSFSPERCTADQPVWARARGRE